MSDPSRSLQNIFAKIKRATQASISRDQMQHLGEFAVDLVVKRTRLGYGVPVQFGDKYELPALSPKYVELRRKFAKLSNTTTASKSNLTLTGQMLASVAILKTDNGSVRFGPTGSRSDSKYTNDQIAAFQEQRGRTFNRISRLESDQILREFRRTFGDLLNNNLIS